MSNVCVYHGDCADGFGAAYAVWKKFPNATFIPAKYGETLPSACLKADVILVDFSYKRPQLIGLSEMADSVLVIDHHKTAQEDLAGIEEELDNVKVIFDMDKSGSVLAWEYFHKTPVPNLLLTIQDRDLWRFKLLNTREIMAAVFSYDWTFELFDEWIECWSDPRLYRRSVHTMLVDEGKALERQHAKNVCAVAKNASVQRFFGFDVPIVNCPPMLASDVGNLLAKGHPFAVMWYEDSENRYYSLRSDPEGKDVSELAKMLGGGGHRHAAGFKREIDKAVTK